MSSHVQLSAWILCIAFSAQASFAAAQPPTSPKLVTQVPNSIRIGTLRGNSPERGAIPIGRFAKSKTKKKFSRSIVFDRYLSLLVTDVDTVSQLSFTEVMTRLASQRRDLTKELLFSQWWDSANPKPGLTSGPHCNDVPPTDSQNLFPYQCAINGNVGRQEGEQASYSSDVFTQEPTGGDRAYSAIAVSNRIDLMSPYDARNLKYPDCGEYRIIFARNTGKTTMPATGNTPSKFGDKNNRNLISFEARIPNPDQSQESPQDFPPLCQQIMDFWYRLSDSSLSGVQRGKLIHDFFMLGKLDPYGGALPVPVIDVSNFEIGTGQIRTNQFMNTVTNPPKPQPCYNCLPPPPTPPTISPNDWVLREFRISAASNALQIVPVTVKTTPGSILFSSPTPPRGQDPRLSSLITAISKQIGGLLGGGSSPAKIADINSIQFSLLDGTANAYESDESKQGSGDIVAAYAQGNPPVTSSIDNAIQKAGSKRLFNDKNVVDRIRTQTCAGCHEYSDTIITNQAHTTFGFDPRGSLGGGAVWPTKACGDLGDCSLTQFTVPNVKSHPPMEFTQISEMILSPSESDNHSRWRYAISLTAECLMDYREFFIKKIEVGPLATPPASNCPH